MSYILIFIISLVIADNSKSDIMGIIAFIILLIIRLSYRYYHNKIKDIKESHRNSLINEIIKNKHLHNEKITLINEQKEKQIIIDKLINKNKELQLQIHKLEATVAIKIKDIPILAKIYEEKCSKRDLKIASYLENKKRPAPKTAERIKLISQDKKKWILKSKELEYKCLLYESLIPSLPILVDECKDDDSTILNIVQDEERTNNLETDYDNARLWISTEDYNNLSSTEKYQKALENWYFRRHKSKIRIGTDYEEYVGYLAEQKNYHVTYYGKEQGIHDLGRDLICVGTKCTYIIQCKCWSKNKQIHENVINQLLGTSLKYCIEPNSTSLYSSDPYYIASGYTSAYDMILQRKIIPLLVTTTTLSDTAKEFATALGVQYRENFKLGLYPMIKCNINGTNKIYHLPFDQQYKRTKINKIGEFMALTTEEAEQAGFRRAMRHQF